MKALIFKKSYAVVLSLLLVLAILFSNVAQIPSAIFAEATDDTDAIKSGAGIVEEDETNGENTKDIILRRTEATLVSATPIL